jgi:HAD superfamily hydrolase (TIGR01458 family)
MARAVLLDIDGVLTVSWSPLPGAPEAISWLRRQHVDLRLLTNTSSRSRSQIAQLLKDEGMEVRESEIVTAVSSAARHLAEKYPGRGCFVVNEGALDADLEGVEIVAADSAGVVLLGGAGPSIGYVEMNAAFRLAMEGIPLVALHRNTRYEAADGPALDMGAFIAGLQLAASIEIPIVGKPAPSFFRAAIADLDVDPGDVVMVGDDMDSDVLGSQAVGMRGVLVKTGKFRPSDLERNDLPTMVIQGIGDLPEVLPRLWAADSPNGTGRRASGS